jgi:hypothetical protein
MSVTPQLNNPLIHRPAPSPHDINSEGVAHFSPGLKRGLPSEGSAAEGAAFLPWVNDQKNYQP